MIFFLYGTDHYRVKEKLKELKQGFTQKRDETGLNVINLNGENLEADQLRQEALATPFLGEKKMIIVKNVLANKKQARAIIEFLKNYEEKIDNILCFIDLLDEVKSTRQTKAENANALFQYLTKQKFHWQFNLMNNLEVERWLKKYLEDKKILMEKTASQQLVAAVGNNLDSLILELGKLAAYRNGQIITNADIKELVRAKFDENIFNLVDALGHKDKKLALKLTSNQLRSGNSPLAIFNMMARQFKILLQVKTEKATANSLKLHPFVFKKARDQSQKFTKNQLLKIYQELVALEARLKSGTKNPELLFDLFIMNMR
ncbi:MAG: DNA polymerase III subunit delta [Patescibacteria group bacterium]